MIKYNSIGELYEEKIVAGTPIIVLKDEYKSKIFSYYQELIKNEIGLELTCLNDEINIHSQNILDNKQLLKYLEQQYIEANEYYLKLSRIIPVIFHSDYKTEKEQNESTFYSLIISEVSEKIMETGTIPETEEFDILAEWLELELYYARKQYFKKKIEYYTLNPITNNFIKNPYPLVFKNFESVVKFKNILYGLNALDENGKIGGRGFRAKANAIFSHDKSLGQSQYEKKLFMPNVTIKIFTDFLNTEFEAGIEYNPNYKLSVGSKHINIVKRYYS